MLKLIKDALLAIGIWAAMIAAAEAHAHLKTSIPAASSKVAAPSEIRLQFSEAIEPRFSQIRVETKQGAAVPAAKVEGDADDKAQLILKLPQPLKPGSYKVDWRVTSVDTHKMHGSFTFEVQP